MTTTINNEHKELNFSSEREQSQACLNSAEHEKNQGRKVLNVPNLRFPEFEGEWENCKFRDVCSISTGNKNTQDKIDDGIYPFYVRSQTVERINSWTFDGEAILTAGDGVGVGKVFHHTYGKIGVHQRVYILSDFKCDANYLFHFFSSKFYNRVKRMSAKNSVDSVRKEMITDMPLSLPSHQEQVKIGYLLSLLDERIATQSKIIEDLKKLKSAIIEKVFCSPNKRNPMCRIEGFEQALSTYKMCDFSSRIATKNKDSKCSLVLTIAAQYGLVNQESFFNKSVASENLTGYYLLHKGEFAYNRSYSAGYDWGVVKRLDNYDEGVLSTLYICFNINETIVDSDYLAYYFESSKWHKGLSDIAGEGARNHGLLNVSMTDYFNTKHRFPVIEEQKAIAKMLNTIAEKERKATLLGECYQKQKQYLLCQMFT